MLTRVVRARRRVVPPCCPVRVRFAALCSVVAIYGLDAHANRLRFAHAATVFIGLADPAPQPLCLRAFAVLSQRLAQFGVIIRAGNTLAWSKRDDYRGEASILATRGSNNISAQTPSGIHLPLILSDGRVRPGPRGRAVDALSNDSKGSYSEEANCIMIVSVRIRVSSMTLTVLLPEKRK